MTSSLEELASLTRLVETQRKAVARELAHLANYTERMAKVAQQALEEVGGED